MNQNKYYCLNVILHSNNESDAAGRLVDLQWGQSAGVCRPKRWNNDTSENRSELWIYVVTTWDYSTLMCVRGQCRTVGNKYMAVNEWHVGRTRRTRAARRSLQRMHCCCGASERQVGTQESTFRTLQVPGYKPFCHVFVPSRNSAGSRFIMCHFMCRFLA
jgi:hypothetical protein